MSDTSHGFGYELAAALGLNPAHVAAISINVHPSRYPTVDVSMYVADELRTQVLEVVGKYELRARTAA